MFTSDSNAVWQLAAACVTCHPELLVFYKGVCFFTEVICNLKTVLSLRLSTTPTVRGQNVG